MRYPEDFINKIICGDCLETMKGMPDNCIDTIITDPPYKIGFMGKDWDGLDSEYKKGEWIPCETCDSKGIVIEENIEMACPDCLGAGYELNPKRHDIMQQWHFNWAIEALRVAKPGSTLLCFGGTRTYHRLACAIEDAGWILKDCIMWLYGSGFPKASDISQTLDKNECKKQLEEKLGRKATKEEFKKAWDNFRKVIGQRDDILKKQAKDLREGKRKIVDSFNAGANERNNGFIDVSADITAPATPEATLWNGWKSHGLKPAYEPILVAMKPNEGSYANNALKYGVAGLNIDGGRIDTDRNNEREYDKEKASGKTKSNHTNLYGLSDNKRNDKWLSKGRYPANVILDEEAGRLLDERTSHLHASGDYPRKTEPSKGMFLPGGVKGATNNGYFDTGGASRFFYCAKASKAERNRGCEGLPLGDAPATGRSKPAEGRQNALGNPRQNNHPTVKPLSLMKYLCTLTKTPTGGIVLDPFCGSGTTLIACKESNRDYIGIDNNEEYCEISRKRVNVIPETLF